MPEFGDILIGGVAIAPLVIALVSLAKLIGFPAEYAKYLNGALSTILWLVAAYLLPMYPAAEPLVNTIVGAVVVFLSASGVYQLGKSVKK